jgi:hypothetical protein
MLPNQNFNPNIVMEVEIPWKPIMVDTFRRLNWHLPKRSYVSDGEMDDRRFKCTYMVDIEHNVFDRTEFSGEWRPTLRLAEHSTCKDLLSYLEDKRVIRVEVLRRQYVELLEQDNDDKWEENKRLKLRIKQLEEQPSTAGR